MKNLSMPRLKSCLIVSAIAMSVSGLSYAQVEGTITAETASPDDGQILQIVRTLNDGEIAQAELALEEASSDAAKSVAQMIIRDHGMSNGNIDDLDIELEESSLSRSLEMTAMQTQEELVNAGDNGFDCAYLTKQVEQHQMALETASTTLVPNASSDEVSTFLAATTPKLEGHLQSAQTALSDSDCN